MDAARRGPGRGLPTGEAGAVVLGRASIDVLPTDSGSHVVWVEELRVRLVPGWGDPLLASTGRRMFGKVLDALLASPGDVRG